MSHYIQQLKAASEAAQHRQADQTSTNRTAETDAARESMTPLADRMSRLLVTIPAEVQRGGLSLPTLRTMLRGLGWRRVRYWRGDDDGGFSALWHPPESV